MRADFREEINPIIRSDYPDPDVIRVGDTYYMISTTMHFMPGGVILRSYDLAHWEIAAYLFDTLDGLPAERLEREESNYAGGMWAASLRYHNGRFYAAFMSHTSGKTWLFTAERIEGPWFRNTIQGTYHDCSLLFDDDGRIYIVYGQGEIKLTELSEDLSGPKPGGLDRILVRETGKVLLGYEGSHIYKIQGRYYLFLIHWPSTGSRRRTQACFAADSLTGEFSGKDVLDDDRGYCNQGVAQGGIVDTPDGRWYAVLFQDSGAVGRMPVLVPVRFEDGFPVFGTDGRIPAHMELAGSRPYYRYAPLYTSDDFLIGERQTGEEKAGEKDAAHRLRLPWQWNHAADPSLWTLLPGGGLLIRTGKTSINLTHAVNCLTQRAMWPKSGAEVELDATGLREGDVAGLCILQGDYVYLGVIKEAGCYYLIKVVRGDEAPKKAGTHSNYMPGSVVLRERLDEPVVRLAVEAGFDQMKDTADFFRLKEDRWVRVGKPVRLHYTLEHFAGARFGLFVFSTEAPGGEAVFRRFRYRYEYD